MAEISIAGLTFAWNDAVWSAYRKFDFLPLQLPAVPTAAVEPALPDTYDVLLTAAGGDPAEVIRAVCETAGVDRPFVEAAMADLPRFAARRLSQRVASKLVMRIMQAGGWSEMHPHEAGNKPRPSWMDAATIESTRQMAEMFSQTLRLRGMSGLPMPNLDVADEMLDRVEELRERGQAEDEKRRGGLCSVTIQTSEIETSPSAEQVRAIEHFCQHEKQICDSILDAIFRYYRWYRQEYADWFDDDAEVNSVADLWPQFQFNGLSVRADSAEGEAILHFAFHCDWEEEHGLGVCVHHGHVLDVGDWDVGETGPCVDYSPWLSACATPAERDNARRVAAEFETPDEPQLGFPGLQYLQAMMGGTPAGLDFANLPPGLPSPLFAAIESLSGEGVSRALQLGAKADVRNPQGQTPLAFAQELLANYIHALQLQERELAALNQLENSPPGTPPPAGTMLSGLQAFRAMASSLLGQTAESGTFPVADHRRRYETLVANSKEAVNKLQAIVRILEQTASPRVN